MSHSRFRMIAAIAIDTFCTLRFRRSARSMPRQLTRPLLACALLAPMHMGAQDAPGGTDHPLIARYAGAQLNAYMQEEYVELEIVRRTPPPEGRKWGVPVGGKLSLINYLTPPTRTALEVFRNYQTALKAGGFTTTYECELDGCRERRINGQGRYAGELIGRRLSEVRAVSRTPSVEWTDNPSYFISAERSSTTGTAYVILFVTPGYAGSDQAAVFQFVLEAKPVDDGLVTVSTDAMRGALATEGRIALYGLTFAGGTRATVSDLCRVFVGHMGAVVPQDRVCSRAGTTRIRRREDTPHVVVYSRDCGEHSTSADST